MTDPRNLTGTFRFDTSGRSKLWTDTIGNLWLMDPWGNLLPVPNVRA